MTINQALDNIFFSYQNKDLSNFPSIKALKNNLSELKIIWGGNTKVENESMVRNVIKYGTADPDKWD